MAAEDPDDGDPEPGSAGDEGDGGTDRRDGEAADDGGSGRRSIPALFAGLIAWIVGPVLVAVGAFGMATSTGAAGLYVLVGLLVTPRTRRELCELCRILCG